MIAHVVQRTRQSGAKRVIIAIENTAVINAAEDAGAEAVVTHDGHESGTERLAEAIDILNINKDEVMVNVQGDEPLIEPDLIAQAGRDLSLYATEMATLATPIRDAGDAADPNVVKVVLASDGTVMYLSQAMIPWNREANGFEDSGQCMFRHIGLYAYRAGFLRYYLLLEQSPLEQIEKLEQLRVLYHEKRIHVSLNESAISLGVDIEEDLKRIREMEMI